MKKWLVATTVVFIGLAGYYAYWSNASPLETCFSCHEIQISVDMWQVSAHRDIACKECHGTALSSGWHSLKEKSRMLLTHYAKDDPKDIRLSEEQVIEVMTRCRSCHENEYAGWLESGHSVAYTDIFLNVEHNSIEQPYADCLRCHGMFFDGAIEQVVTPLNRTGPWSLIDEDLSDRPVIPCLTCHENHSKGIVARQPASYDPKQISYERQPRLIKAAFYSRHEQEHFAAEDLPDLHLVFNTEDVLVSDDERQRICVQCHAPNGFHQAGTSDDRTPRGVHEGFSCLACHETHSHDARQSCGQCHPAASNCGLDVRTMDTSFKSAESANNIHFVQCSDCHPQGIPRR